MLLIGLAGAMKNKRDRVSGMMAEAGLTRVSVYANYTPPADVANAGPLRVKKIDSLVSRTPKGTDCLVLPQVVTQEEAERIRALGGYICHVEGSPPTQVRIERGDVLVTPTVGGHRHYLDPAEALSEIMMRAQRAASTTADRVPA